MIVGLVKHYEEFYVDIICNVTVETLKKQFQFKIKLYRYLCFLQLVLDSLRGKDLPSFQGIADGPQALVLTHLVGPR